MLMITAVSNEKSKKGIIKDRAKINLDKKAAAVACQISRVVCWFSASSEMWIPSASEKESAMAIVTMPPITTMVEWVLELRPMIRPSVVIAADVSPKLTPFIVWMFISNLLIIIFYLANQSTKIFDINY